MGRRGVAIGLGAAALAAVAVAIGLAASSGDPAGSGPDEGRAATAGAASPAPPARVDRFDGDAALTLARRQVAYGERPAGSPQLRRLAAELATLLPDGRLEAVSGHPGLQNVVGVLPGRGPALVFAAHYDTIAAPGFVGANNGAAGTAVVAELARTLAAARGDTPGSRSRELRFVLFDGEQPPSGLPEDAQDFSAEGLRGSRAYVAAHPGETHALILLDYVGGRDMRLARERSSDAALWEQVRVAARATGVDAVFPDEVGAQVIDDHTPFLRAGVPAVDLIDWRYDGHTTADTIERLSAASLDAVGETLAELVRRMDAGAG